MHFPFKSLHQVVLLVRVPRTQLGQVYQLLPASLVPRDSMVEFEAKTGQTKEVWESESQEQRSVVVMFSCSQVIGTHCRQILLQNGIGNTPSTDVNVLSLDMNKNASHYYREQNNVVQAGPLQPLLDDHQHTSTYQAFSASIKARVSVENLVETIYEASVFTFDFFCLVMVASILALTGLLTNSPVITIASMLVSPMMGPFLGLTFGSVLLDRGILYESIHTASIALVTCILVGFVGGVFVCGVLKPDTLDDIPTTEMSSRATADSLLLCVSVRQSRGKTATNRVRKGELPLPCHQVLECKSWPTEQHQDLLTHLFLTELFP